MLGELVDDPASARVSDVELALHERDGSSTLGGDRARRTRKKRVELALLPLLPLPLGGCALFQDLFHVSRRALRLPVVDHAFDLRVADESALDAGRLARVHRLVQHVAATQQLLGATRVENDAAVDLRADCKRDTRRDVGLD